VSAKEIVAAIDAVFPLAPLEPAYAGEVAERWGYRDGSGDIGVIASVTQPFCRGCTRARLTIEGKLVTCLFAAGGLDLRGPLRAGASDAELRELVEGCWTRRSDRYSEERAEKSSRPQPRLEMYQIGGWERVLASGLRAPAHARATDAERHVDRQRGEQGLEGFRGRTLRLSSIGSMPPSIRNRARGAVTNVTGARRRARARGRLAPSP
jgi:hypothetical protein